MTSPSDIATEVVTVAKEHKINEQIRVRQVRLIGDAGEQLGIIDTKDAMRMATEKNMDLVMVSPNTVPPVCRLLDYGKFRFEAQQQEKEARKRARSQEVKSIKLRVKIGDGDFDTKLNHVKRFLKDGHKVKVTIMFRGRERTHPELGERLLTRVAETLGEYAIVESPALLAGMDMNMLVAPTAKAASMKLKASDKAPPPDDDDDDGDDGDEASLEAVQSDSNQASAPA
jgi:translation initiation factor IF-3